MSVGQMLPAFGGLDIDPQTLADMAQRQAAQDAIIAEARAKTAPKKGGGRIHAGMDITRIMAALSRIGWGPIRGYEFAASRAILIALMHAMEDQHSTKSAAAAISAAQLAKRASVSLRHARRCLQWLEDAGVIEWWRGGIRNGAPTVGLMRIVKAKLVEWILAFRSASDAEDRKRNHETRLRIQRYRLFRNNQRPKAWGLAHEDMTAPSSSLQEEGARSAAPRLRKTFNSATTKKAKEKTNMSMMSPDLKKCATLPPEEFMPLACGHGATLPRFCNRCRYEGWTQKQEAERIASEEAARLRAEQRTRDEADEEAKGSAFAEYMRATYPDKRRSEWSDLILVDEEAARLANA